MDLLIDPWHTVRANWEEHARYLFHEYAGVHRVLQEATFANDEGKRSSNFYTGVAKQFLQNFAAKWQLIIPIALR